MRAFVVFVAIAFTGAPAVAASCSAITARVVGMDYADARRVMIAGGWVPTPRRKDVSGNGWYLEVRERFPETETCAGTGLGQCRFMWRVGRRPIVVFTTGDYILVDKIDCR